MLLPFRRGRQPIRGGRIDPPFLPNDTRLRYTRSHVTPSEFLEKWSDSAAVERSNAQSFVIDLCAVLNVDPPHAATSDRTLYGVVLDNLTSLDPYCEQR